ncbi:MAG: hypothetical protein O7G85_01630, partial [Planctomycetota bacterium]|nr:hypothetical protein [Planctomycetota bacterium]
MSVGTKVILAIIGLLIIILITYYGYMLPTPTTGKAIPADGSSSQVASASIQDPTGNPMSGDQGNSIVMGGGSPAFEDPEQFVSRPQGLLSSGLRNAGVSSAPEINANTPPVLPRDTTPMPQPHLNASDPGVDTEAKREIDSEGSGGGGGVGEAKSNQPAAIPVEYTIRPGDTLMTISSNWFGDPYDWERIVRATP